MFGFTLFVFMSLFSSYYTFEARPVSGTQAWAKAEDLFLPPKGYFIKVLNTSVGDTIGGSYESSERFHVYVLDEENFLKFVSGAPNYSPLSSTLWSTAACFYATSLKGGRVYIVIHNPTDRVAFLHFCLHFYDTESILVPRENTVLRFLMLIGGLLSAVGLGSLLAGKVWEKKRVPTAQ